MSKSVPPRCKKAQRQPFGPPTHEAMKPISRGLSAVARQTDSHCCADLARECNWVGVGEQRAVNDSGTGLRYAGTKSSQEEQKDISGEPRGGDHDAEDRGRQPTMGARRDRSASRTHGNNVQDEKPPEIPATKVIGTRGQVSEGSDVGIDR